MSAERLRLLRLLRKLWLLSPERLWLASIALRARGHWIAAFVIKQLNALLYHNSLAPGATVSSDVSLGHNSIGIVVNSDVEIGRRVKIWHNVTLASGRPAPGAAPATARANGRPTSREWDASSAGPRSRIVVEDDVNIGANAVLIAPRGRTLRIGRGARVGAGTVVTHDVPAGATVVGPPSRILPGGPVPQGTGEEPSEAEL